MEKRDGTQEHETRRRGQVRQAQEQAGPFGRQESRSGGGGYRPEEVRLGSDGEVGGSGPQAEEVIEPTPEDIRNGVDSALLEHYHEISLIDVRRFFGPREQHRPPRANSKYSPHRWRNR